MRLYLVRHADAVEAGKRGGSNDAERTLSDKGRRQASKIARFLKRHDIAPDTVVSSPLVRARQTAEILAARIAPGAEVTVLEPLQPGGGLTACLDAFRRLDAESVLAIGHMPDIAALASKLATGGDAPFLDFGKAAVAAFEIDGTIKPGSGILQWFVRPRLL